MGVYQGLQGYGSNIVVCNGTIVSWGQNGLDGAEFYDTKIINVNSSSNGSRGIKLATGGIIQNCSAEGNLSGPGISSGVNSMIGNSQAWENAGDGFNLLKGSRVKRCKAFNNKKSGFSGLDSQFTECQSRSNAQDGFNISGQIMYARSTDNLGHGIAIMSGIIRDTDVRNNGKHGIISNGEVLITDCTLAR
ncbi:MAG: hypothetical protein GKR87_03220 [Kiritimatiellae bacterium]|nr:hypothetical protein [Kiritimatiellia bacterium]